MTPLDGYWLLIWKFVSFAILWSISKKSDKIFKGFNFIFERIVLGLMIAKWVVTSKEFKDLNLVDIL